MLYKTTTEKETKYNVQVGIKENKTTKEKQTLMKQIIE